MTVLLLAAMQDSADSVDIKPPCRLFLPPPPPPTFDGTSSQAHQLVMGLTRTLRGHFVTLIEISMKLIERNP